MKVHLGSSLSLRAHARLGSTLAVLDLLTLGSSLSLRSFARLGSAVTLMDFLVLGSSLSFRAFGRCGSSLSILDYVHLGSTVQPSRFRLLISFRGVGLYQIVHVAVLVSSFWILGLICEFGVGTAQCVILSHEDHCGETTKNRV